MLRLREWSRDVILRVWPPDDTLRSQLLQAVNQFREAVREIDRAFQEADLEVTKFRNNINDRANEIEAEMKAISE